MMHSSSQFEISQLRQQNMVKMVESIAVFVFTLVVTAFLPQLLFKYFYANQQLTEQPALFDYIQVGSFLLGVLYFFYAALGNSRRNMKIRKLEKEMTSNEMMGGACCSDCDGMCGCGDHDGCVCGCETDMMSSEDSDQAVKMMKKAASKRKTSRK
jgi:hypothetical protein